MILRFMKPNWQVLESTLQHSTEARRDRGAFLLESAWHLAMPLLLAKIIPTGLLGFVAAGMIAASRRPLLYVGGGVINLKNIAGRLGFDQPFHALRWQGLTDAEMLDGTLPEIAAIFIEAMKTVQPVGQVRVTGSQCCMSHDSTPLAEI